MASVKRLSFYLGQSRLVAAVGVGGAGGAGGVGGVGVGLGLALVGARAAGGRRAAERGVLLVEQGLLDLGGCDGRRRRCRCRVVATFRRHNG